MNNSKIPVNKIGKYIRELSIVVVGVAITLSIGIWITNANNKRDIKLYLEAIKVELEENIVMMDGIVENWQNSVKYANYLTSNSKETLSRDSIWSCGANTFYGFQYVKFSTTAFEIFKISGLMRLMDDKKMLSSVCKAYEDLGIFYLYLEEVRKFKTEEMIKDMEDPSKWEIPMYNFFAKTSTPYEVIRLSKYYSEKLRETVSNLDQGKVVE
ncbi:MAG: hypothetical protein FWD09_02810 [Lentimicrobiaceae bacterium]|nr:hypothetical protein [Lentimicrobiaceae bacterium]